MRHRIPPQLKETVTIVRKSALERGEESTIASGVICMVVPETNIVSVVENGVPIADLDYKCLLEKPNTDIAEGDIVRRSDNSELQIYRVMPLGGVMQLMLSSNDLL